MQELQRRIEEQEVTFGLPLFLFSIQLQNATVYIIIIYIMQVQDYIKLEILNNMGGISHGES